MLSDALQDYLSSLNRDECYRVSRTYKQSPHETTEEVFFQGINGAELGPFVRKIINLEAQTGSVYERIFAIQRQGKRFLYLPRIIDCFNTGSHLVVIMEYVCGQTLESACECYGPSPLLAKAIFPHLCDAVCELHEGFSPSIIHRDLKPSNIIVSFGEKDAACYAEEQKSNLTEFSLGKNLEVCKEAELISENKLKKNLEKPIKNSAECRLTIIDFGISRTFKEGAEKDTQHFGTRAWAPPEQFGFGQTDTRSDIYSLGMILFFLLVGQNPCGDDRSKNFAKLHEFDGLRSVVIRATELDPKKRFANVHELKFAFLEAIQEGSDALIQADFVKQPNMLQQAYTSRGENVFQETCADKRLTSFQYADRPETSNPAQEICSPRSTNISQHKGTVQQPTTSMHTTKKVRGRQPNTFLGKLLTKIPRKLGIAWDILLLCIFVVCIVGGIQDIIYPDAARSSAASFSLAGRILAYGSTILLVCGPTLFAICDRRPLMHFFPKLKNISLERDLLICLIIIAIGIIVIGLMGTVVN